MELGINLGGVVRKAFFFSSVFKGEGCGCIYVLLVWIKEGY